MPVSMTTIAELLRPGLEAMTKSREYQAANRVLRAIDDDDKTRIERAKYDALSPEQKEDYDALTRGMMPRLASEEELARRRKEREVLLRDDVKTVVDWAKDRLGALDL